MGLQKVAFNFMAERGGKLAKSLLCSKPVPKLINFKGLKYAPALEKDTVQFANKELTQINANADDLLQAIRKEFDAEYLEKIYPDIVNVEKGNIKTGSELDYWRYKVLENLRKDNPNIFLLLGEKGSVSDLYSMIIRHGDTIEKIAKNMSLNQIKAIFSEVDNLANKTPFLPKYSHYINALIMKYHNPKAYEYIQKEIPELIQHFGDNFYRCPSTLFFKNVTPEQLRVMKYDSLPQSKNIEHYVSSSDYFVKDKTSANELSEELSKYKLSSGVKLFRAEGSVGMFDSISIDKDYEKQLRKLLEQNKEKAKATAVTEYTGLYRNMQITNLYEFLSSKKTLTLADALQLAKYGDEKFLKELINRIQKLKIIDKRFKSFTLDEGMADYWRLVNNELDQTNNTTMIQHAFIEKGTQGGYYRADNKQYEVILNNTPKQITFQDVTYHKDTDYFELNSIIQNV